MSKESGGGNLKTEGDYHAHLMCLLRFEITKQDLRDLKHVIKTSGRAPTNSVVESKSFYALWEVLAREGLIKVGEYNFLREVFEMLKRMDLSNIIRVKTDEIKEFRSRREKMAAAAASMTVSGDIAVDDPQLHDFEVVYLPVDRYL